MKRAAENRIRQHQAIPIGIAARDGEISEQHLRLHACRAGAPDARGGRTGAAAPAIPGAAGFGAFQAPKIFSICSSIASAEKSPTTISSDSAGT